MNKEFEELKKALAEDITENNKTAKLNKHDAPKGSTILKIVVWSIALVAIIFQAIFWGWWTILTVLPTCCVAYYLVELLLFPKKLITYVKEIFKENKTDFIVWTLAIVSIPIQILFWGYWAILTGIITIVAAIFLPEIIEENIIDYFKN